jgi:hypothetical protein
VCGSGAFFPAHHEFLELTTMGEYKIEVFKGNQASGAMAYELNLMRTVPPLDPIPITFGQQLEGKIDHFGDIDFYLFEFERPGDKVIIRVDRTEGLGTAPHCFELRDPENNRVGDQVCGIGPSAAVGEFPTLPNVGTYTIRVFAGLQPPTTVIYQISLECLGECSSPSIRRHYLRISHISCDHEPCQDGDNFSARASLNNPLTDSVELKFGYLLPDRRRASVGDPHQEIPGETRWEEQQVTAGQLPPGPPGRWHFCGRLLDLQLGQTLAVHCRPFDVISSP